MTIDDDSRLHALDILRGLALFGMILVHFHRRMRLEVTAAEDLIGGPSGCWWSRRPGESSPSSSASGSLDALATGYGFGLSIRPLLYFARRPHPLRPGDGSELGVARALPLRAVEWLWRSVTYARLQPLSRSSPCAPGISTSPSA